MEIKLYFQMLLRGWWLIVCAALAAVIISLALSYATVPQYQASARLIISPNSTTMTGTSSDIVRSLDTLDRQSIVSTYAEVLGSDRVYNDTLTALKVTPAQLKDYTRSAVVLPNSSVLDLTITGPNPQVAAQLANAISRQTIAYTINLNQVYKVNFLDSAVAPVDPISPQPLRDASLALVLGIAVGAVLAILREQIQVPIQALRRRSELDPASSAFNRRYFQRTLEEAQARSQGNVGLGLIQLDGLRELLGSLPPSVANSLLQQVTSLLRRELRGNDQIGRWGETQYAVLLPSTPLQPAERTLERIRQALSGTVRLDQLNAPVVLDPYVSVVVSSDQESPQALIERAEKALEQSRQKYFAGA